MSIAVRTDSDIQTAVQDELEWTPDVDAAGIGVSVEDGAVSLSGEVDSYAERRAAVRAAQRVRGVSTVADNLNVHPKHSYSVSTTDIAKEVEHALRWAAFVPDSVKAELEGHTVTLTGEVGWEYQRNAAKRAIQYLRGVYMVNDLITLKARPSADDTERRITEAITRNAQLDADAIHVSVDGTTVTLTGTVHSWAEKQQAGHAAWSSPHVMHVDNRISLRAW
jgi:osmotically-inducible protein OsmY